MKTRSDLIPPPQRVRPAAQREARTPAAAGAAGNQREAAQLERIQAAFGAAPAQLAGEEEELQMKTDLTAQRIGMEEEEPLQGRFETAAAPPNKTGMPDALKSGVEALSGMDLSDVRVHANSSQPAQLGAHAYAQGNDIHVAPGQEQHLPHEAWHVVQQRQGRVQPTTQMAGVDVNDDHSLEAEADAMGAKALQGDR